MGYRSKKTKDAAGARPPLKMYVVHTEELGGYDNVCYVFSPSPKRKDIEEIIHSDPMIGDEIVVEIYGPVSIKEGVSYVSEGWKPLLVSGLNRIYPPQTKPRHA